MATQLNIKDPETVRLARDIAARRGQTVTAVIRQALERDEAAREAAIGEKIRRSYEILGNVEDLILPEYRHLSLKDLMDSIYDDSQPDGFARYPGYLRDRRHHQERA